MKFSDIKKICQDCSSTKKISAIVSTDKSKLYREVKNFYEMHTKSNKELKEAELTEPQIFDFCKILFTHRMQDQKLFDSFVKKLQIEKLTELNLNKYINHLSCTHFKKSMESAAFFQCFQLLIDAKINLAENHAFYSYKHEDYIGFAIELQQLATEKKLTQTSFELYLRLKKDFKEQLISNFVMNDSINQRQDLALIIRTALTLGKLGLYNADVRKKLLELPKLAMATIEISKLIESNRLTAASLDLLLNLKLKYADIPVDEYVADEQIMHHPHPALLFDLLITLSKVGLDKTENVIKLRECKDLVAKHEALLIVTTNMKPSQRMYDALMENPYPLVLALAFVKIANIPDNDAAVVDVIRSNQPLAIADMLAENAGSKLPECLINSKHPKELFVAMKYLVDGNVKLTKIVTARLDAADNPRAEATLIEKELKQQQETKKLNFFQPPSQSSVPHRYTPVTRRLGIDD